MEFMLGAGLRPYDDPRKFADAVLAALEAGSNGGARNRAIYDSLFSKAAYVRSLDSANEAVGTFATRCKITDDKT